LRGACKSRAASAIALAVGLTGCTWDLSGWWAAARSDAPQASEFAVEATADLQAPEGLRAASGELREIPLQWEPVLVGDVAGYVVERAPERDGPFESLARISGRLATTYVDRKTIPARPSGSETSDAEPAADDGETRQDGVTWFYRVRAYSPDGAAGSNSAAIGNAAGSSHQSQPGRCSAEDARHGREADHVRLNPRSQFAGVIRRDHQERHRALRQDP